MPLLHNWVFVGCLLLFTIVVALDIKACPYCIYNVPIWYVVPYSILLKYSAAAISLSPLAAYNVLVWGDMVPINTILLSYHYGTCYTNNHDRRFHDLRLIQNLRYDYVVNQNINYSELSFKENICLFRA